MKAILLAAGKGSRISKNIPNIPKSTLDINGTPLIIRTVTMLEKMGIETTIVVGYQYRVIKELLKKYNCQVNIVYNPFFDVTNSIGSLWMAKDFLVSDDLIIANADVFWEEDILNQIINQDRQVFMLSDRTRADDGDYFFFVQDDKIVKYGKELTREQRNCEYVGIAYINKDFVGKFKSRLLEMIDRQEHNCWWENVLYSLTDEQDIYSVDVDGKFWAEVDFIEDYERILNYAKSK